MINKDYLFTSCFHRISDVHIEPNSVYIYGHSTEDRSHLAENLPNVTCVDCKFVSIEKVQDSDIIVDKLTRESIALKSQSQMQHFLDRYRTKSLYIDYSGLNIRACASLIQHAVEFYKNGDTNIYAVYVEPDRYKQAAFKKRGYFHDLAEEILGINPLPGFGKITPDKGENNFFLIAFLGFEGGRFSYIVDEIVPPQSNIIPVVGVSGFRAEYPFVTYAGNRQPLIQSNSWPKIRYAKANSVVDACLLLKKIHSEHSGANLKIAPVGTKPHTIASILYAIKNPNHTELVFDNPNPIRKSPRTDGFGLISITSITELLKVI